jgi:hypothetical protein
MISVGYSGKRRHWNHERQQEQQTRKREAFTCPAPRLTQALSPEKSRGR